MNFDFGYDYPTRIDGVVTSTPNYGYWDGKNDLSVVINGSSNSENHVAMVGGALANSIVIELSSAIAISGLVVWHYYQDGRTYFNTKTEVSIDGINWLTVRDSNVDGLYVEKPEGNYIYFENQIVKFIRDSTNNSSVNNYDHFVEIQTIKKINIDVFGDIKITKPTWSNKETREQANPQPEKLQTLAQKLDSKLIGKSGNYSSILDTDGNQRRNGYYQSTVLINNVATANRRVMCFTNNGQLVDETISDSNGDYRFDHLDLNKKYMFVAQYSNELNTPPDYTAVAADWQSPTPYKE